MNNKATTMEATVTASNEDRIRYAHTLMGYYDSIAILSSTSLSPDSKPIQILVGLAYDLISDLKHCYVNNNNEFSHNDFATEQLDILLAQNSDFKINYDEENFEFLIDSIKHFGETK